MLDEVVEPATGVAQADIGFPDGVFGVDMMTSFWSQISIAVKSCRVKVSNLNSMKVVQRKSIVKCSCLYCEAHNYVFVSWSARQ